MKEAKKMTVRGLVLRHVALQKQAMALDSRRGEVRRALMWHLRGGKRRAVAGRVLQKVWVQGFTYTAKRDAGWRLEVKANA